MLVLHPNPHITTISKPRALSLCLRVMAAGALSLAASAFASKRRTEREGSSSGPLPCLLRRPISSSSLSSLRFPSSTVELNNRPNRLSVHCTGSSPPPPPPPPPRKSSTTVSTKLYVSGLSFRTTEESLRNAFQDFGQLVEVNLVMDRVANRPRGFAFLRYAMEKESKRAIEGMHGKFLDGRVIFVEVAKPRSELQQESKQIIR